MDKIDETFIANALRQRHGDGWLYLTHLPITSGVASGYRNDSPLLAQRIIDAFAIALWPSLGFRRVAYEIKVDRTDWLNELKDPTKRAQAVYLSHEFWFVLAEGVYQQGDLYDSLAGECGMLIVNDAGEVKKLWAPRKRDAWPVPDGFMASIIQTALRNQR